MHSKNKKKPKKSEKKRKWGSATKNDDEEGEEYVKEALVNNVHDNDNDLMYEHVDDQEDFQINDLNRPKALLQPQQRCQHLPVLRLRPPRWGGWRQH